MSYLLPELTYNYDALEPHIDAKTMEIHHTLHHQTYVNNINAAIAGTEFESLAIEEVVRKYEDLPENLNVYKTHDFKTEEDRKKYLFGEWLVQPLNAVVLYSNSSKFNIFKSFNACRLLFTM